jgi:hypothetical protein
MYKRCGQKQPPADPARIGPSSEHRAAETAPPPGSLSSCGVSATSSLVRPARFSASSSSRTRILLARRTASARPVGGRSVLQH